MIPERFRKNLRALFGKRAESILDALSLPPVRAARVNTLKTDTDAFFARRPFPRVPFSRDGFYADGSISGSDPDHLAGLYYIQEASAQLPVAAAADFIRGRVLDLCAAPGGKSCQLAALGPDVLYANEYVYKRASALKSNLERLGVRNALVTCNTAEDYAERLPDFFDAVAVDAPCSGEGMFRKEPAAAENWSEANVAACAERSFRLLLAAADTLREGGVLVYSTCTLNREENESVIERFIAARDFSLLPVRVPAGAETGFIESTLRVLPDGGAGEGHFACVLRKNAGRTAKARPLAFGKRAALPSVWSDVAAVPPWYEPIERDGALYLSPAPCAALNYLSYGVKAFETGKTVRPYHSLAMALRPGETAHTIDLAPDDPRLAVYLSGGELSDPPFSGWGTITVHGYPLGLVKCGDTVKNHYPKGLLLR